jgi:hypothetical protein
MLQLVKNAQVTSPCYIIIGDFPDILNFEHKFLRICVSYLTKYVIYSGKL